MDLTTFHPVFLCLVWINCLAAHVDPPINVTLHCHNLSNVLQWGYDQLPPGLRFRVDIGKYYTRSSKVVWVDSPALQADVSFLSDPEEMYLLTVTAVIGQNESEPSPPGDGITFSYYQDSPVDRKCFVDLPSVNVTTQPNDNVLFRFEHPWLFYHHKLLDGSKLTRRKKKSHDAHISKPLPVFSYDVVIINQKERHHSFRCEESVCEKLLPVDAAQAKHCLKIKGELQKMLVKAKQDYCALPLKETPPHDYITICIVVSLLAVSVVFLVLYMVYRKMTRVPTPLPISTTFNSPMMQQTMGEVHESISRLEVEPTSPTPLLATTEEEDGGEFTPSVPPSTDYDLRLPIGVPSENEGVSDVQEAGQPNDDGSAYMQGNNLEDEALQFDEGPSPYERRVMLVELGPDDLAEGYRG